MKTTDINPTELERRISAAAADLLKKHGTSINPPITAESMSAIGEKHKLPIGIDINKDPVARAITTAAYSPEAFCCDDVAAAHLRLEQIAQAA